jgi:hypothetical protein
MTSTIKKRLAVGLVVAVLGGILLLDALHVFDDAEYHVVPHGSHSHYVPRDRDPTVPLENFPTSPPRPGERILPNGEVVTSPRTP